LIIANDQTNYAMSFHRIIIIILVGLISSSTLHSQDHKVTLKDTLDNAFDLSDYVINMHGFVPWPVIISEPALGNFGGALALVFMKPKKSLHGEDKFRFPDVTGVAGMYTLNNSWGAGALRQGTFPSIGMRYTVAAGYADVNMDYYRDLKYVGEKKFEFNLAPIFFMLDVSENIYKNRIFGGFRYQFVKTKVDYDFELDVDLFDSIFDSKVSDKNLGLLGLYGEMDYRNSMFTPDKGIRFKATYFLSRSYFGSDFDVDRLELLFNSFFQPYKWLVCGLRAEWQMVGDEAPFYYLPYVIMRGFPMMKYQGEGVLMLETEQRFDVTRRWSLLGFFGTGKTYSDAEYLKDPDWHFAGGTGFRYLVARLFKLRMGVDVAMGPDNQFAYYIVFGHNWNR
jgi:hypothetical protein